MLILGFYGGLQPLGRHLGNGVGTYNLNGGLLTGGTFSDQNHYGTEYLGIGGTAIFNQSGGTNSSPGYVFVGGCQEGDWQGGGGLQNPYNRLTGAFATYSLSGGLLFAQSGLYVGDAGTGTFTQTGGINLSPAVVLGGVAYANNTHDSTDAAFGTTGTYSLQGGVLQTAGIYLGPSAEGGSVNPTGVFNFTAGTLQAASALPSGYSTVNGFYNAIPITLGSSASNVATFDANGQTVGLGNFTGPGQLRVIDTAGGGAVVFGGTNGSSVANSYTGGTLVFSDVGSDECSGPPQHGRFDRRRRRVDCVEFPCGDALRNRRRGTNRRF